MDLRDRIAYLLMLAVYKHAGHDIFHVFARRAWFFTGFGTAWQHLKDHPLQRGDGSPKVFERFMNPRAGKERRHLIWLYDPGLEILKDIDKLGCFNPHCPKRSNLHRRFEGRTVWREEDSWCLMRFIKNLKFCGRYADSDISSGAPGPRCLTKASRCHLAAYCSRGCQRVHWVDNHRTDCSKRSLTAAPHSCRGD